MARTFRVAGSHAHEHVKIAFSRGLVGVGELKQTRMYGWKFVADYFHHGHKSFFKKKLSKFMRRMLRNETRNIVLDTI